MKPHVAIVVYCCLAPTIILLGGVACHYLPIIYRQWRIERNARKIVENERKRDSLIYGRWKP